MKIRTVYSGFAVCEQLEPGAMKALADAGYSTVICNRPDGEEDCQPALADLRKAADEAGLAFHHIPVSGGEFPSEAVAAFAAARKAAQGPVLAFCRTGTRSITLEMLANLDGLSVAERIAQASQAGYDLSDRLSQSVEG